MPDRQLLDTAIRLRIELHIREHGGKKDTPFFTGKVQPAIIAALNAGWHPAQIHDEADRRYDQWCKTNGKA